jgi:hypothetical protein
MFLEDSYLLHMDSVIKMNKTNSADLNDFLNFHSLLFSVGNVLMLANLFFFFFFKRGKLPLGGKLGASTVAPTTVFSLPYS